MHQASKEGAGRFLLDQIDYLKTQAYAIFAVVPSMGPLCEALSERGVQFEILRNPWWTKAAFAGTPRERAATLAAARVMAGLFLRWEIDLVYTQTIVAPAGALAAAMAGKPHVWHIHEFSHNPECIEMTLPRPALAHLLNLTSNLIIFNSHAVASEWQGWLPANHTAIVRNWVNRKSVAANEPQVAEFSLGGSRFNITVVGSVLPWKRQLDAVQATAQLIREGLDISLLMVGPFLNPAYRDQITAFIAEQGLQERIRLLGYVENPQRLMQSSQATVVCSRLEPFGRVTIESMILGVPVVGANSGGTAEIIEDEVSGLLYPVGDIDALARQLRRLIMDKDLRQRLGAGAVIRAGQFSSAEKEMRPLLGLLSPLRGASNPSWPLGEILGAQYSLKWGLRQHGRVLLGRAKRRVKDLLRRKS